jgi:hypothetical protein
MGLGWVSDWGLGSLLHLAERLQVSLTLDFQVMGIRGDLEMSCPWMVISLAWESLFPPFM